MEVSGIARRRGQCGTRHFDHALTLIDPMGGRRLGPFGDTGV